MVKMREGGSETEDELIDLNKEPVERKRKRVVVDKLVSDRLPESPGRVLRSRTLQVTGDAERQVIQSEVEDKSASLISPMKKGSPLKEKGKCGKTFNSEEKDDEAVSDVGKQEEKADEIGDGVETEVPVSPEMKKRRGRPPKAEGKCGVSLSSSVEKDDKSVGDREKQEKKVDKIGDGDESVVPVLHETKKRRGRPPKADGKCGASLSSSEEKDDKSVSDRENQEEKVEKTGDGDEAMVPVSPENKKRRGRPPKVDDKCGASLSSSEENDDKPVSDEEEKMDKIEKGDATELPVSPERKKRLGRPPKAGSKCGENGGKNVIVGEKEQEMDETGNVGETDIPVSHEAKKRRGRPPKGDGKCGASLSSSEEKDDKPASDEEEKMDKIEKGDATELPVSPERKKRLGRPPKTESKCGENGCKTVSSGEKEQEMDEIGNVGETDIPVSPEAKRRRGRPPKTEGNCRISSPSLRKRDNNGTIHEELGDEDEIEMAVSQESKKKRGRPQKVEGECLIPSQHHEVDENQKLVKRRGRPPKLENRNSDVRVETKLVNGKDKKARNRAKRLKVGITDLENGDMSQDMSIAANDKARIQVMKRRGPGRPPKVDNGTLGKLVKKRKRAEKHNGDDKQDGNRENGKADTSVVHANGEKMGLREQKQLLRDQIVAMLYKAGWKVEYRLRQSKDYQDAVYVDPQGRTYWSSTKAYNKLKDKIDAGKASDDEVSAFSPIPAEMFSMLFRITEKGKKVGKKRPIIKISKKVSKKEASKDLSVGGIKSRKDCGKRRTLLARKPKDGDKDGYKLYEGKRSLLSWMIDLGTVPLGGHVKYKQGRTKRNVFEGKITKDGICCDCCSVTYTIRDFEAHAQSTLGKPYENICLDSGKSLSQCIVDSWMKHKKIDSIGFAHVDVDGDDPNDDTCNICGDGGNLICCDSCPSTFHHGCLHIEIPTGDWHCIYCSCKFCGDIVSTTHNDNDLLPAGLSTCHLCEERFHMDCVKDKVAEDCNETPSFCGNECVEILEGLQAFLGVRHELEDGFFYTVLQYQDVSKHASLNDEHDFAKIESNSKIAVAFAVMDECFQPIVDGRSGTNMIHNVVYNCGSNIRRLNYSEFFTVILERGEDIVSVASIRLHGRKLAEMPFIGTRYAYRRQGLCRRLLSAIDMVLGSLGVEKLVIPAISNLFETWTKVFGFSPLKESEFDEMTYMSVIAFPGVDMLQKSVSATQPIKEQTNTEDVKTNEDTMEDRIVGEKSEDEFVDAVETFEFEEPSESSEEFKAPVCGYLSVIGNGSTKCNKPKSSGKEVEEKKSRVEVEEKKSRVGRIVKKRVIC